MTVAEYRQKYESSVVIDQIRLLTASPHSLKEEVLLPASESEKNPAVGKGSAKVVSQKKGGDPMLLRSIFSDEGKMLDVKIKEGLKVEYVHGLGKNRSHLSKNEFLEEYASLRSKVLFIWEGYTSASRFVHNEYSPLMPGHLPFKRLAECPNRVDVQPHPAILGAVDALLATLPALQRGYIGVHMRRGDFINRFGRSASVTQIAKQVKEVLVATGLHTIFLCTDGSPSEVRGCSIHTDFSNIGMPYKYHQNSSKWLCVNTKKTS